MNVVDLQNNSSDSLSLIRVLPQKGFLNKALTISVINAKEECFIKIYKEAIEVYSTSFSEEKPLINVKFSDPGQYIAHLINKEGNVISTSNFEINDAVILGDSSLKKCYLFDGIPYSFIVKNNSLLIFDEANKTMMTSQETSPTFIYKIDDKTLLFEMRNDSENENYELFSLETFVSSEAKTRTKKILLDDEQKLLYIYQDNLLLGYDLKIGLDKYAEIFKCLLQDVIYVDEFYIAFKNDSEDSITLWSLSETKIIKTFSNLSHKAIDFGNGVYISFDDSVNIFNINGLLHEDSYSLPAYEFYNFINDFQFVGNKFPQKEISTSTDIKAKTTEAKIAAKIKAKDSSIKPGEYFSISIEKPFENIQVAVTAITDYQFTLSLKKQLISIELDCRKSKYYTDDDQILWSCEVVKQSKEEESVLFHNMQDIYMKKDEFKIFKINDTIAFLCILNEDKNIDSNAVWFLYRNNATLLSTLNIPTFISHNSENYQIHKNKLVYYDGTVLNIYLIDNSFSIDFKIHATNFNCKYLSEYGIILYEDGIKQTKSETIVYSVELGQTYPSSKQIKGTKSYYYLADNYSSSEKNYIVCNKSVLVSLKPFQIMSSVPGDVVSHSSDLSRVIIKRDNEYLLWNYNIHTEVYEENSLLYDKSDEIHYSEALLVPNGSYALLKQPNNENFEIYDIKKNKVIKFLTANSIRFSKEGKLILEDKLSRNAKIIDPVTFNEVTSAEYHFYKYYSSDGSLYSDLTTRDGYYDCWNKEEIGDNEYDLIEDTFKKTNEEIKEEKEINIESRKRGYRVYSSGNNHEDLSPTYKKRIEKFIEKNYRNPPKYNLSELVYSDIIYPVDFIAIHQTGKGDSIDLISRPLKYHNYLAFSKDNKYICTVGKPSSDGLIQIFKIDSDPLRHVLKCTGKAIFRTSKAVWTCGFAHENNCLGTYDSDSKTYLIDADTIKNDDYKELGDLSYDDANKNMLVEIILGKSFECFSPKGNLLAFSAKSYVPISHDGPGHCTSKSLYLGSVIHNEGKAPTVKLLRTYNDHGKNVQFAAFSETGDQLLSRCNDGVVIIRNIRDIY